MLQDVVLASEVADVIHITHQERPVGPHGGTPVEPRGSRERQVTTHQGKTLRWRRRDGRGSACQLGGFLP